MRFLFKLLLGVAVLGLLVLIAVFFAIDPIAEAQVEKSASRALGVKTSVDSLDLKPFSGEGSLEGLRVSNPEGFSGPSFLTLGSGGMKLTLDSLLKERVEIPRLTLGDIEVVLERQGLRTNASVILEHLRKRPGAGDPEARKPEGPRENGTEKGKEYVVRELEIQSVKVKMDPGATGGRIAPFEVEVPTIVLRDVGSGGNMGLGDLCAVVVQAILETAVKQGGGRMPPELLSDIQGNLEGLRESRPLEGKVPGLEGALPEDAGDLLDRVRGILEPSPRKDSTEKNSPQKNNTEKNDTDKNDTENDTEKRLPERRF